MGGGYLKPVLAGIASAGNYGVFAVELGFKNAEARQFERVRENLADKRGRFGPLHGQHAEPVAGVFQFNIKSLGLFGEPGEILGKGGSVNHDEEPLGLDAEGNGVVYNAAVIAQNMRINALAGLAFNVIAINILHKIVRVGSGYENLTHVGNVEYAAGVSYSLVFGNNAGELHRHFPAVKINHPSAGFHQCVKKRSPHKCCIGHKTS